MLVVGILLTLYSRKVKRKPISTGTSLSLRGNKIGNLSAISRLIGLETLDLQYNHIRNLLSLSKLNNLKELFFQDNNIVNCAPLAN